MTDNSENLFIDFDQGAAAAMDPTNDDAIQEGGKAVTTLTSFWLHRSCLVCKHTFRLGDVVEINPDGTVRHNTALLPCLQGREAAAMETTEETTRFFEGMEDEWPAPEHVIRLEVGHKLLAEPKGQFKRHRCVVCGHTLRLHDHVLICPCSPDAPLCLTAVHRDIIHGLHCWEAWNPGANKQEYCPITSRKLNE